VTKSLDRAHLLLQVMGEIVVELVLEKGEGCIQSSR